MEKRGYIIGMNKTMDHTGYPKRLRSLSTESVKFILADAAAARDAMPDGVNAGYYADEVNYCADEIRRRGCPT
jgi:hypothetical protein